MVNKCSAVFALFILVTAYSQESRLSDSMLTLPAYDSVDWPAPTLFECAVDRPSESGNLTRLFTRWGECFAGDRPLRKSFSLNYGVSYDSGAINDFLLASFQWSWTYKDFWVHSAPDGLMFRLEAAGGMRVKTAERGIVSCGMFAQRYLDVLATDTFRPYVDAGVGIIYTDFQNENQGLRVNFNPRFSIGTDIKCANGSTYFCALRLYHISNAELHRDNRGINAGMIVLGRYF